VVRRRSVRGLAERPVERASILWTRDSGEVMTSVSVYQAGEAMNFRGKTHVAAKRWMM
jgi:hypothetical protein